ncbi:MAG: (Fe-S)-binding protein [Anaerolineae bacterium]|nr:(Fe-S)-binding protein [Anaerolineae bacterium]
MLTPIERLLFILLVAICLTAAYTTFKLMADIILQGQGKLRLDNLFQRLVVGTMALFSQGRIIRHRRLTSFFHYLVAFGFIFYGLVNMVDVLEAFMADFAIPGLVGDVYRLLADLFGFLVLLGVAFLLIRRFPAGDRALKIRDNVKVDPNARIGIPRDSLVVGSFILIHIGFRLLGQSFHLAHSGPDVWQPVATLVAGWFNGLDTASLEWGRHISWWISVGLVVLFIPYFPYTKHAHLFMGPLNFMTRPERKALGALTPLNFEDESIEQFGAAALFDLHQTHIMDAFACIMCNRCQEACPAYATGKELSPAAIEINKRYYLRNNMAAVASGQAEPISLLEMTLSESALWACTTCGACVDVCPVGNEPMFDIMDMRRHQVMMESSFPAQFKGAFTGMERLSNPWQATDSRLAWTESLDFPVPTVEENPDFDILFWVGCAGAFDPNAQEVARSVVTILKAANLNFAILGEEEACTGDSARRAGNEALFYEMALANIEKLNEIGADKKRIVASCPHCLHTIGKEYGGYGGHYEIIHHTQLITELVGKGVLRLNGNQLESATFHDPCYLGRHNGVYTDPREALAQAGMTLLEMDRNKSNSFCCGAGGAQMWKEEEHGRENVNINRYREAKATGAKVLAVGCPFCAVMMHDANGKSDNAMVVKDVAQIVAEAVS